MPVKGPGGTPQLTFLIPKGKALSLRKGELVKAEVIRMLGQGRVEVRLKGATLTARTTLPLKPGVPVSLRVDGLDGNQIRLHLLGTPSESEADMREILLAAMRSGKISRMKAGEITGLIKKDLTSLPSSVRKALPEIQKIIDFFKSGENLQPDNFGMTVRQSGGFFETALRILLRRLLSDESLLKEPLARGGDDDALSGKDPAGGGKTQKRPGRSGEPPPEPAGAREARAVSTQIRRHIESDLKGLLLSLREKLTRKEPLQILWQEGVSPRTLRGTIDRLISNIEHHQFHSALSETVQTWIPLIWEDLKDGELRFERGVEDGEERTFRCAVRLDLEGHGRVISLLYYTPRGFNLRFFTESREFMERIISNRDRLESQFEEAGLALQSITVSREMIPEGKEFPEDRVDIRT